MVSDALKSDPNSIINILEMRARITAMMEKHPSMLELRYQMLSNIMFPDIDSKEVFLNAIISFLYSQVAEYCLSVAMFSTDADFKNRGLRNLKTALSYYVFYI